MERANLERADPERAGRQGFRTVQALRGLACVLVVAYHAVDSWGAAGVPPRAADAIWPNGAAGVDVFFVVSGFVMGVSGCGLSGRAGAWRFAVRRCRRVVPLYWLMTCAKLALLVGAGRAVGGAWHVAASLLFIPSRDAAGVVRPVLGVGWTLQFEMLFYVLFALAIALRRPTLRVMLPVLMPLAVAGFFRRPDWPAPLMLANGLVLEFCLGLAIASVCTALRPGSACATGLFVVGLLLLLTLPQPGPWRFLAWGLPAGMVLAGAVWLEPVCGSRLPGWALALGNASYAIYLLHPFLVPVLAKGVSALAAPDAGLWLLAALSVVVSVAGGAALDRWVDQPMQLWCSGTRQPRRAASAKPMAQLVQA